MIKSYTQDCDKGYKLVVKYTPDIDGDLLMELYSPTGARDPFYGQILEATCCGSKLRTSTCVDNIQ
jgi:hypothetical protein